MKQLVNNWHFYNTPEGLLLFTRIFEYSTLNGDNVVISHERNNNKVLLSFCSAKFKYCLYLPYNIPDGKLLEIRESAFLHNKNFSQLSTLSFHLMFKNLMDKLVDNHLLPKSVFDEFVGDYYGKVLNLSTCGQN